MKKLLLFAAMIFAVSCINKQPNDAKQERKMRHFQNELLSVDYPATWTYEDEWEK